MILSTHLNAKKRTFKHGFALVLAALVLLNAQWMATHHEVAHHADDHTELCAFYKSFEGCKTLVNDNPTVLVGFVSIQDIPLERHRTNSLILRTYSSRAPPIA